MKSNNKLTSMATKQLNNNTAINSIWFTHVRHATSIIEIGNVKILIDPMLSDKGSLPPVSLTMNKHKNPLISLPFRNSEILNDMNYLLLTHLHFDHFDKEAIRSIEKSVPVLCADPDRKKMHKWGFTTIRSFTSSIDVGDFEISRYPAVHGKGLLSYLMGKGSSYLIGYKGFKIFITGDCILTEALKNTLIEAMPDIVIANAGKAEFRFGKPITMSMKDIQQISGLLKKSKIYVVHLDALNHCSEPREYCKEMITDYPNIFIPVEGEKIKISNLPMAN